MNLEIPSFEKDLWGQYNILHERLKLKKVYIKNLSKSLEPIYETLKDLLKKLDSFKISPDPTISQSLYSENETSESKSPKLYGISLTLDNYIKYCQKIIDYLNQTMFHIMNGLEELFKKMEKEKEEFNTFIKCLKILSDNKIILDKNMKIYHQKMSAAERSVLDLKNTEIIQLSINNSTSIIENKNLLEEKANQLTNEAIKPFKIYFDNLKKVNEIREESIKKQKHLLNTFQNIEEEVGKTNTNFAQIISLSLENIEKELVEKDLNNFHKIIKNIKINKDIKQLIMDYKGKEKPEEEILFIYFPSIIKFEESNDNKTFEIYKKSIEFIKEIIQEEYPNYDEQLEIDKNNLREMLSKLFEKYEEEKSNKIKEYIKNIKMHEYFLILLSKSRSKNNYDQSKILIDFFGDILNYILDISEKTNNFNNAKNCIILSQTFYYNDNGYKYYILEKIKNHKWLSQPEYWIHFAELMIEPELNRLLERQSGITKEDILNNTDKITNNLKKRLSDIIYTQLLPLTNNMKEFGINLEKIVEISEGIFHKYDFLNEEEKNNIYSLISKDQEEINKIREYYSQKNKFQNHKENNIINNINNNKEIILKSNKDANINIKKKDDNNNNEINNNLNKKVKKIDKNLFNDLQTNNMKEKSPKAKRSSTVVLTFTKSKEKAENNDNKNKIDNLFKNINDKVQNKGNKNQKKEEVKEKRKDDTKKQNNSIKSDMGNQMIKMIPNSDKLLPLKPLPKNDNDKKIKIDNNLKQINNSSNPFGVVLKKINK